jgi:hypothetical protein
MNTSQNKTAADIYSERVSALLLQHGWQPFDGVAIAGKTFATAVGPKMALVYLQDYGKYTVNYILTGDYQSEGRNILESQFVLLPKAADEATLRDLVKRFAADVSKTIASSYAVRILQGRFKPGEFVGGPNGLPAIIWWRPGVAAAGEPSTVTEVREYPTDAERMLARECFQD